MKIGNVYTAIILIATVKLAAPTTTVLDQDATTLLKSSLQKTLGVSLDEKVFAKESDVPFLMAKYFAEKAILEDNLKRSKGIRFEKGVAVAQLQYREELPYPTSSTGPVAVVFARTMDFHKDNAANIINASSPQIIKWMDTKLAQIGIVSLELKPDYASGSTEDLISRFQSVIVFFPVPAYVVTRVLLYHTIDAAIQTETERMAVQLGNSENPSVISKTEVLLELTLAETMNPNARVSKIKDIIKKIDPSGKTIRLGAATYFSKLRWDDDVGIVRTPVHYCLICWKEN